MPWGWVILVRRQKYQFQFSLSQSPSHRLRPSESALRCHDRFTSGRLDLRPAPAKICQSTLPGPVVACDASLLSFIPTVVIRKRMLSYFFQILELDRLGIVSLTPAVGALLKI